MQRKGSLDISVNAIVIIVLAFTFLALGLTFLKGVFKDVGKVTGAPLSDIQQKIVDDIITTGDKLRLDSYSYTIEKNSQVYLYYGVGNKQNQPLNYNVEIYEVGGTSPTSSIDGPGGQNLPSGAGFQWDFSDQTLDISGEGSVKSDVMSFFSPAISGSYQYKVIVHNIDDDSEYASKSFFVKVT